MHIKNNFYIISLKFENTYSLGWIQPSHVIKITYSHYIISSTTYLFINNNHDVNCELETHDDIYKKTREWKMDGFDDEDDVINP